MAEKPLDRAKRHVEEFDCPIFPLMEHIWRSDSLRHMVRILADKKRPILLQELFNEFNLERQLLGKNTITRQSAHELVQKMTYPVGIFTLTPVKARGNPFEISLSKRGISVLKDMDKLKAKYTLNHED